MWRLINFLMSHKCSFFFPFDLCKEKNMVWMKKLKVYLFLNIAKFAC